MKTQLTPIDKIKAAYFYHVGKMDQTQIAMVLEATNPGRVNEAIKLIEKAVGLNDGGYKNKKSSP
jgi:hypothetical protein